MRQSPLRDLLETYHRREVDERRAATAAADRPGAGPAGTTALTGSGPVEYLPYGMSDDRAEPLCELVATLGAVETEYASIRRAAGIFDCPHRGTIEVTGGDARRFLDSMLTAPLANLQRGQARPAFWLNRKGRIDADLLVADFGDRLLIDVDVAQADSTCTSLASFVFTEDVELHDRTASLHRLAIHGAAGPDVLAAAGAELPELADRSAFATTLAGVPVHVIRRDQVGACGLEIVCPIDAAAAVAAALLATDDGRRRVRPIGWLAYNVARIEGGTPLFNVDFGPTSLPHETGVVHDRVSFKKGCYLGQEVVARMEHLGKPKQQLVGLRVEGEGLPVAGGQVFEAGEERLGDPVGVVTSSAVSPMLGATPIAFAMLKGAFVEEGTRVLVNADGAQSPAVVGGLRFWSGPEGSGA